MSQTDYRPQLYPNQYYHCVNHAVGSELLFREEANYHYFLEKYRKYIAPITTTYAYCLMPNHFHFLIRIHSEDKIQKHHQKIKPNEPLDLETFDYHKFISQQFSNFFNAYAKAYNKRFLRRGALFEDYFKRPTVKGRIHFLKTLRYIHQNPVKHGFAVKIEEWKFNSYHAYLNTQKKGRYKREVFLLFEDVEDFKQFHQSYGDEKDLIGFENL